MSYVEFEKTVTSNEVTMRAPHSHNIYELYFLKKGKRHFFIGDKMFAIGANTFIAVPPFVLHKTEGGAYERINVFISPDLFDDFQNEFLKKTSDKLGLKISEESADLIFGLLEEGVKLQQKNAANVKKKLAIIARTVVLILSENRFAPVNAVSSSSENDANVEVLKIIYYLNTHFCENIKLSDICDEFYTSKVSLCKKFKKVMHCSIMEYVSGLRINKAKDLLRNSTELSIEQVADACGYSSANYFGLMFKKQVGLSPLQFKKTL